MLLGCTLSMIVFSIKYTKVEKSENVLDLKPFMYMIKYSSTVMIFLMWTKFIEFLAVTKTLGVIIKIICNYFSLYYFLFRINDD